MYNYMLQSDDIFLAVESISLHSPNPRVPQNTYINANAKKTFANPVFVLVLTELAMNLLAIKQLNTPGGVGDARG